MSRHDYYSRARGRRDYSRTRPHVSQAENFDHSTSSTTYVPQNLGWSSIVTFLSDNGYLPKPQSDEDFLIKLTSRIWRTSRRGAASTISCHSETPLGGEEPVFDVPNSQALAYFHET